MEPFLKKIARTYLQEEKGSLYDCCFVFPNRRSGTFFKQYLTEEIKGNDLIFPEITTITDFIGKITHLVEANRVEQLFLMYEEYLKLAGQSIDFDQFLYWGDMVLNDFNDVDRYLVNARELFKNIRDYRDINANYLTKEQQKVISEFWGEFRSGEENGRMWADSGEGEPGSRNRFLRLWRIMFPLYSHFKQRLEENGVAYSGMLYRKAVEILAESEASDFPYKRIIFVGFSTLSTSERKIFDRFKNLGIGDFYWDYNSPAFEDTSNKGTFFLEKYVKDYPSRYDIGENKIGRMPVIHVVSVPSGGGQAKIAGLIIADLANRGQISNLDNAIDTAVVLPEEKYLNSVLFSMPDCIKSLNITMGYPMRNTSIASFMNIMVMLFSRRRKIRGAYSYYFDDLEALLAHPFVRQICDAKSIMQLMEFVRFHNYYFVPEDVVKKNIPLLSILFENLDGASPGEVICYAERIIAFISDGMRKKSADKSRLEMYYIRQYRNALSQLKDIVESRPVQMKEKTFFFLLERMLSGITIAFEGEPLSGLQIMGVLETRLLDFKNLLVLSLNEKIFPSKHYKRSFIPDVLRRGYGIATREYQDSMFTYYFYRMLSRAENVYLLYDSRVQGISSGEESRFLYQIERIYNRNNWKSILFEYRVNLPKDMPVTIKKDDRIIERLNKYFCKDSGKFFSASMINSYVDCPLKFYLSYVESIKEDETLTDFIDSATFGNVIHKIMQAIYDGVPADGSGRHIVGKDFLADMSKSLALEKIITKIINSEYNKTEEDDMTELTGESRLIGRIVKYYIKGILKHDERLAPFEYIGSEVKFEMQWPISEDLTINYKQFVDRIDRVSGVLRFVDYKTGSDKTQFKGLDSLFEKKSGVRMKAILQLLLYCNAYAFSENYDGPIQPVIYNVRDVRAKQEEQFGITVAKRVGKGFVTDYHEINEGVMEKVADIIREIRNPEVPFIQTTNVDSCMFCPFREVCAR